PQRSSLGPVTSEVTTMIKLARIVQNGLGAFRFASSPSNGEGSHAAISRNGLETRPNTASRTPRTRFPRLLSVGVILVALLRMPAGAHGECGSPGAIPLPNVQWAIKDSVAGCPAGDSLVGLSFPPSVGPRPSQLRILVYYSEGFDCPKVGVPPESIWVTVSTQSGTATVNDAGAKIFADDSTDAGGFARITVRSLSGCGRLWDGNDHGGRPAPCGIYLY